MKKIILLILLIPLFVFSQTAIDVGGNGGNKGTNLSADFTYIDLTNPANAAGTIDSVTITLVVNVTTDTVWIATGVSNGTSFTPREYSIGIVTGTAGNDITFSLATSIAVIAGDNIGIFTNAANNVRSKRSNDGSGNGLLFKGGNNLLGGTVSGYNESLNIDQLSLYGTGLTPVTEKIGYSIYNEYSKY